MQWVGILLSILKRGLDLVFFWLEHKTKASPQEKARASLSKRKKLIQKTYRQIKKRELHEVQGELRTVLDNIDVNRRMREAAKNNSDS